MARRIDTLASEAQRLRHAGLGRAAGRDERNARQKLKHHHDPGRGDQLVHSNSQEGARVLDNFGMEAGDPGYPQMLRARAREEEEEEERPRKHDMLAGLVGGGSSSRASPRGATTATGAAGAGDSAGCVIIGAKRYLN